MYMHEHMHYCIESRSISYSYPDLHCLYRSHHVVIEVLEIEAALNVFAKCGLPGVGLNTTNCNISSVVLVTTAVVLFN